MNAFASLVSAANSSWVGTPAAAISSDNFCNPFVIELLTPCTCCTPAVNVLTPLTKSWLLAFNWFAPANALLTPAV